MFSYFVVTVDVQTYLHVSFSFMCLSIQGSHAVNLEQFYHHCWSKQLSEIIVWSIKFIRILTWYKFRDDWNNHNLVLGWQCLVEHFFSRFHWFEQLSLITLKLQDHKINDQVPQLYIFYLWDMLGTFDFRFSALCEPTLLNQRLSRPGDSDANDEI